MEHILSTFIHRALRQLIRPIKTKDKASPLRQITVATEMSVRFINVKFLSPRTIFMARCG